MFANFNSTMAWYDLVEALERSFSDEAERGHSSGPILSTHPIVKTELADVNFASARNNSGRFPDGGRQR